MQVAAADKDRIIGAIVIDPLFAGQRRIRPRLLVPAAAGHPFAWFCLAQPLGDPADKLRRSARAAQIDRLQRKAAGDEMGVGVDEPRQHGFSAEVAHRCLRQFAASVS